METTSELRFLERMITEDLSAFFERSGQPSDPVEGHDFKSALASETERIKDAMAIACMQFTDGAVIARYIQSHQLSLIRLAGQLLDYVSPDQIVSEPSMDQSMLCHHLYRAIQELLFYLERFFPEYFSRSAWVPPNYCKIAGADLSKDLTAIEQRLKKMGVHQDLVAISLEPFKTFILKSASPYNKVTYNRLMYLHIFKYELLKFTGQLGDDDISFAFQLRLLYLNFNSLSYYHFCIRQVRTYIGEVSSSTEKLDRLLWLLKVVEQGKYRSELAFNTTEHSLQVQVSNWIKKEIRYLQQSARLVGHGQSHQKPSRDKPQEGHLRMAISVPQLAFLLRLLKEQRLLTPDESINFTLRLATEVFRTKESEAVSFKSIRNKYYEVESGTKESVRHILETLMQAADEY